MKKRPKARWVTLTWAATEIDLSVRQLQEYAKRPGSPRSPDGKGGWMYEWPAFNRFIRETARADAIADKEPTRRAEFRDRREEADAEIREMERDKLRGLLVERDLFESALRSTMGRLRERLLALPVRAAPMLVGLPDERAAEVLLDRFMGELCEELRNEPVPEDEVVTQEPA